MQVQEKNEQNWGPIKKEKEENGYWVGDNVYKPPPMWLIFLNT